MKQEKETQSSKTINKGFTLIELLVIVLIIGILAAIALPQYKTAVAKSRYATLMDITKSIAQAEERYFLIHDNFTRRFADLDIDMPQNYISKWSAEYCYDWGGCNIDYSGLVFCVDKKSGNSFQIYSKYSNYHDSLKGKMFCGSEGTDIDNFSNVLCKKITGLEEPTNLQSGLSCGNNFRGYVYPF